MPGKPRTTATTTRNTPVGSSGRTHAEIAEAHNKLVRDLAAAEKAASRRRTRGDSEFVPTEKAAQ